MGHTGSLCSTTWGQVSCKSSCLCNPNLQPHNPAVLDTPCPAPAAFYCSLQVMCFPSSHLSLIKGATAGRKTLKRIHSLVDIDITLDAFEDWPYDLQQVCACVCADLCVCVLVVRVFVYVCGPLRITVCAAAAAALAASEGQYVQPSLPTVGCCSSASIVTCCCLVHLLPLACCVVVCVSPSGAQVGTAGLCTGDI
jgi:hypothetical protein